MYWQRECRDYVAPPDQIVFYQGSQQHVMRLMASDSAYRFDPRGFWDEFAAIRTVRPWNQLSEMVDGPPGGGGGVGPGNYAPVPRSTRLINRQQTWNLQVVVFLHERISPSGNTRLVVVRHSVIMGKGDWSVITAGARRMGFFGTLGARSAQDELTFINTVNNADGSSFPVESICFYAGQVAPTDTSRFTIAYEMDGKEGTIDGQLLDDDHVRLMVRRHGCNPAIDPEISIPVIRVER